MKEEEDVGGQLVRFCGGQVLLFLCSAIKRVYRFRWRQRWLYVDFSLFSSSRRRHFNYCSLDATTEKFFHSLLSANEITLKEKRSREQTFYWKTLPISHITHLEGCIVLWDTTSVFLSPISNSDRPYSYQTLGFVL